MKKVLSLVMLMGALALTACGGGSSESSASSYKDVFKKVILLNGNEYSCPTQVAHNSCTTDDSCKAAKCTLTKAVNKPNNPALKACAVKGKNIYGKKGESCTFSLAILNKGAPQTLICGATGGASIANSFYFGKTLKFNDTTISCQ
ncbi:hypothetical protein MOMA_05215 [Moraxella macacae 0408225]|uniref:Lipoprotein n=1 Tax=Moraxella macacae 0408225 TaxID=1230338 RepID=L2FA53_9GAMM|nr:hypothetical protein [Moraxella macacae]ELA09775.1 hypothetical protein MOMA_05215 [Moraxella macacae 0408225]